MLLPALEIGKGHSGQHGLDLRCWRELRGLGVGVSAPERSAGFDHFRGGVPSCGYDTSRCQNVRA